MTVSDIKKKGYVEAGKPGLIMAKYLDYIDTIKSGLEETFGKESVGVITGSVKGEEREQLKEKLNNGEIMFLLGTRQTLATGHNLQGAHYNMCYDDPDTGAEYFQQVRRNFRSGVDHDCDHHNYLVHTPKTYRARDRLNLRKKVLNAIDEPDSFDESPVASVAKRLRDAKEGRANA